MKKLTTGVALLSLGLMSGCANRPACLALSTTTGALAGATGGGLITVYGVNHGSHESAGSYNWEVAGGTMIGAAAGAGLGYLAGHFLCGEEEAPPPPPPPAPSYEEPPPPPPPPTERRGG